MHLKFYVIFPINPTHLRSVYHLTEISLAILNRDVSHMLLAKYQPNKPTDSGEESV